jgi:hypothetical protein
MKKYEITAPVIALLLGSGCGWSWADSSSEQLERTALLRELLETRTTTESGTPATGLPGASIEAERRTRVPDTGRRQQFEDSQWRTLLGNQQTHTFAPPSQAIPESQWRSQVFDRERQAQDLSADILRRSQDSLSNSHR